MAPFDFPDAPASGDMYSPPGGPVWRWNGQAWKQQSPGGPVSEAPLDHQPYMRQDGAWTANVAVAGRPTGRTLASHAADRINVLDFGAVANGGTNLLSTRYATLAEAQVDYPFVTNITTQSIDWAAIQAAVNYAIGKGAGTVWLPFVGTYIVSDTIDLRSDSYSFLCIEGDAGGTNIQMTSTDGIAKRMFDCRGSVFKTNALQFKGLCLVTPSGTGASGAGNIAFDVDQRQETVWENIKIIDYNEAIKLNRSWGPIISNKCFFWNTKGKTIYAADNSFKGARINGNVFFGNGISLSQSCISIGPGSGNSITENDFSTNYNPIQINNVFGMTITGNYFEASTLGNIEFVNTGGSSGAISIIGNDLETAGATVFKFVDGLTFADNQMYQWAVTYDATATRVTQHGNTLGTGASLGLPTFATSTRIFATSGPLSAYSLTLTAGFTVGATSSIIGSLSATGNLTATNVTGNNVGLFARPTDTTMGYVSVLIGDAANVGRVEWWKPGSPVGRIGYMGNGAGSATLDLNLNAVDFNVVSGDIRRQGTKVVGVRKTGWATATGTATRTTFDTATITLPQLAERVKALIDDLHGTAGHGLIGT